ncbi:chemotaxis protein CheW [Marinobacter bohaiensis]|uniref:chemotaxis protein CheW n=1 Tax=Marinobacter bohaiensis TaxID=2201898 RepID=UPI000DAC1BAE|nr:chemotaxis protein CheW [Marinobacter bohaiensis]
MADNSQVLPCVLIPVTDRQLLLPNVSLAEIVDYAEPETVQDGPDWLVGYLSWRGLRLPVISYDAANGVADARQESGRGRIAVFNTISDSHDALPFLAMVTQGIPSQTKLGANQIQQTEGDTGPADLMKVDVDGHSAYIPNLEYLESLALQSSAA